jgi:hypothetical protein
MLIRALATATLRTASLHLLALLLCGGLLWQQSPRLVPIGVDWLLKDSGVELVTLVTRPISYAPFVIDEIALQTAAYSLRARNISLSQLGPWQHQWYLDVGQLQVVAIDALAAPADPPVLSVAQAWQSLTAGLGRIAQQGRISQFEYCAASCLSGDVAWRRQTDQLRLLVSEAGYGAQLDLRATDEQASFSLVVDAARGRSHQPRLGQVLRQHLPDRFSLEAQLQTSASADLELNGTLLLGALQQTLNLTQTPATPIQLDLDAALSRVNFALRLAGDSPLQLDALRRTTDFEINAAVDASWRVDQADWALTSTSPLALAIDGQQGDLNLHLSKPLKAKISYPELNNARLTLATGTRCHFPVAGNPIDCQIASVSFTGDYRNEWRLDTALTGIVMERTTDGWSATGMARILVNDKLQRLLTMDSQLQLSNTHVALHSDNARIYELGVKSLVIDHNLRRDLGELHMALDTSLAKALKLPLLQMLPELEGVSGAIRGTSRVAWPTQIKTLAELQAKLQVETRFELHNVGFDYDNYLFSGLNLKFALSGWPHMMSPDDAELQIDEVDIGLPLKDIQTRFAIELDTQSGETKLTGQTLAFNLLGGSASASQWWLDPVTQTGFVPLSLQDLALNQILALERNDFDSSGSINGSVPVHIKDGNIDIQQGKLGAIAPGGYIRYRPDQATKEMLLQSGKTKIVLDTLSDFQYDGLDVLLSYSPTGTLIANTALRGRNPGYESGREIRFNLTIEQNLGTLLQSLRMSEDVEKQIQKRSQNRQTPKPAIEVKP